MNTAKKSTVEPYNLISPANGEILRPSGDNLLSDGERLWPYFDGCYYLRLGREALVEEVVSLILRDRREQALTLLLCDRRNTDIPEPDPRDVQELWRSKPSFHQAIELLGYGGLGWYFEHRWIIPTYLSGLSLLHWQIPRHQRVLEIGAGLAHLTAHWEQMGGGDSIGSDVVFSHLWLSQRYLRPGRTSVCFDANGPFPLTTGSVDAVLGHDCLHYLSDLPGAIAEMRRVASSGRLLIGHLHNAEAENFSAGNPLTLDAYKNLLKPSAVYDDAEMTYAWLEQRPPRPLKTTPENPPAAFAFVTGEIPAEPIGILPVPTPDPNSDSTSSLSRLGEMMANPLLGTDPPAWPSEKFVSEYVRPFPYLENLRSPSDGEISRARSGTANSDELRKRLAMGVLVRPPGDWY
ncbi:Methyltransferase domain-containing protein [Streptomyces sp. yr375]|uniref:class I SAM-dependent methyltransferase n=1 Tax=Streptomyces sp. yr375 TaxID=1761906 RepID=UPI0008C985F9|nr:methyltransferase domain-containing protein [Streptomyces sp. yr375]SER74938.1 Methyltransferase domain-containing protein [Streptomyces sp. yr375]